MMLIYDKMLQLVPPSQISRHSIMFSLVCPLLFGENILFRNRYFVGKKEKFFAYYIVLYCYLTSLAAAREKRPAKCQCLLIISNPSEHIETLEASKEQTLKI